jgi:hypothetical protein
MQFAPQVGFFQEIFYPTKVTMIPKSCWKSDDHPLNDSAKSGYKPEWNINLLSFVHILPHTESQI